MSKTHTISITYSGGGDTPIAKNVSNTGAGDLNFDTVVLGGNTTTNLGAPVVMNPSTKIQSYIFSAINGNVTLQFAGTATTSISLADGVPLVDWIDSNDSVRFVPTTNDTYTLRILNADADDVSIQLRMLLQT